jgi:hypothetical protein
LKTAVLKCVKELGYRVNWGIENSCIEMCNELCYRVNWGIENSFILMSKGTVLQSELED